jgi:uncharacterized protein (DUF2236 family)
LAIAERPEVARRVLFDLGDQSSADFLQPAGEAALVPPDSVSWRVFKNPVSLFLGGVAAVLMELAEPRVRTGIWEHTTFRIDPIRRLRRTGLAAMVTIYGARSVAEAMIARVRRMHDRVAGSTPAGKVYRANDPELLNWVRVRPHTAFCRLIMNMCGRSRIRSATGFDFRSGIRGNNPGLTSLMEAVSEQDIAALTRYLAGS